ncbi:hypothetical protein N0539_33265, partial [Pseudomonas aeruginosa]|nr:hypothetical protein [Pseudomonas aeruginosa]
RKPWLCNMMLLRQFNNRVALSSCNRQVFPGNVFTKLPFESVITVMKLVGCPPALASIPIGRPISTVRIKLPEVGDCKKGDRFIFTTLISATAPTLKRSKQIIR